MIRVVGKARVVHGPHLGVGLQETGQAPRRGRGPLQAHRQGLHPLHPQPARPRIGHQAGPHRHPAQGLHHVPSPHHPAQEHLVVAGEELGEAFHHQVGPLF
jgi:hypothetical protein